MRVLLDENLPHDLASELTGHDVLTVQGLGWAGIKNTELLQRAEGTVDALLTMDRNIERQQKLDRLSFGVVVIRARSNRIDDLRPLVGILLTTLRTLKPGMLQHVGDSGAGRNVGPLQ